MHMMRRICAGNADSGLSFTHPRLFGHPLPLRLRMGTFRAARCSTDPAGVWQSPGMTGHQDALPRRCIATDVRTYVPNSSNSASGLWLQARGTAPARDGDPKRRPAQQRHGRHTTAPSEPAMNQKKEVDTRASVHPPWKTT